MPASLTTTTTQEVKLTTKQAKKLRARLANYQSLRREIQSLQEALTAELALIEESRNDIGAKSFSFEGTKITLVEGVNSRLDKKALMTAGVSAAQIEAGTITKPRKAFTKVTLPGGRDDDGNPE